MMAAGELRARAGGGGVMETGTVAGPDYPAVCAADSIEGALALMDEQGAEHVAVIDGAETRRVVGMVSRADIHAAHNRALIDRNNSRNSGHG